jgi:uncharacterized membrane protein YdbT with pleckstrin-like domain
VATNLLTYRCPHCGTSLEVEAGDDRELLVCPAKNCGKPFRAEVPTADPVPRLGVPSNVKSARALPIAERAADQEEMRGFVQLTMFRRYPLRFLMYLLLLAGGVTAAILGVVNESRFWLIVGALAALFAAFRLFMWWLRLRHTHFTVTSKRCILETGIFSQQANEVQLENVREVQVNQNMVERLFRVGDLVIVSDNGERKQVVVKGVHDPEGVALLIRQGD